MTYYVDITANAGGDGSKAKPFNRIQQAADIVIAGVTAGSKLTDAQKLGITVWDESDFENAIK